MEDVGFIQWALEHLNYWTVTLLMAIESSFIPFPSEIVVPPAAYMAASGESDMTFVGIIFFSTLGAMIGAFINYSLALWLGRPIVHRFARSRIGGFFLLSEEAVVKAEQYFNEHGKISTFIGRLVPGIRQLISVPAGLANMRIAKFALFTALGAGVWNMLLATIGWYLQDVVPYDQLRTSVEHYSKPIGYAILAIVLLVLSYMLFKALSRPKVNITND
ncbi:DedA family protein [Porphyromonas levii]|uniref:DedA family protein n=1 Tax=Porphyromonas levii TaxID=28114 RepID=A0A4Y8WRW9_9PORP|nr:DedA family protein [Porphyromonas levii]MBR8703433.1 hypothetical protein [Porphyromonas levii]MBR8712595.1 hypothetical protein [Porphyromonas levii]MBR8714587.1 hypothetical protein [Porphyromonas levii]MBR8727132.1 hypothetical protein [Porphyromonas levii]MBR8729842.1 hypothetical protein [Porphyromonas levii]